MHRMSDSKPVRAVRAVLWDFGGVVTTSPFEAFANYEREHGLPADFIRGLNAANHHANAWAKFERSEVPFDELKPSLDAAYKKIASQVNVPGTGRRDVLGCSEMA